MPHASLLATILALAVPSLAQTTLHHPSPQPNGEFGWDVDVSGGVAVVGAPQHVHPGAQGMGEAVVFRRTGAGWSVEAVLGAPVTTVGGMFGWAVATDGTRVAVGMPTAVHASTPTTGGRGVVFVFLHTAAGWVLEQELVGSDPSPWEWFGQALALEGERLVVGSLWAWNASHVSTGAAYAFRRAGGVWSEEAKLVGADCVANDKIGASVALSGTIVLAGAPYKPQSGTSWDGAAYVFDLTVPGGVQEAKLLPTLLTLNDPPQFGYDVALRGDVALVGSPWAQHGAVHEYERAGGAWIERAAVRPADAFRFGLAVATDREGWLAATGAGHVKIMRRCRDRWGEVARVGSAYGRSEIAWSGDDLLVGLYDQELAWIVDIAPQTQPTSTCVELGIVLCTGEVSDPVGPCPCSNHAAPGSGAGCAHSLGYGARLGTIGTGSRSGNGLYAYAVGLPPSALTVLMAVPATTPQVATLGHGLACLPLGSIHSPVHLRSPRVADTVGVVSWADAMAVGGPWWLDTQYLFQAWYRDTAIGPCGARAGTTNAVRIAVGW